MTPATAEGLQAAQKLTLSCARDGVECGAEIHRVSPGELEVRATGSVTPGAWVELQWSEGFRETGTIFSCKREESGFAIVVALEPAVRVRRERRQVLWKSAMIAELGAGSTLAQVAKAVEISRSTVSLLTKEAYDVGIMMSVTLPEAILLGEVRQCGPAENDQFWVVVHIARETVRGSSVEPTGFDARTRGLMKLSSIFNR